MGTQETILVVEDDPDVRTLHRLWLSDEYNVRTAADGESALAAVDEDVAVILLDRNLPGVNGDEVTRKLRADGYDGVIAMVTANPPDQALPDLQIDEYLRKPVSGAELRALVDRSLSLLDMPTAARELFGLISLRSSLVEAADRTGSKREQAIRSLDDRIETRYRQAIDDGISPRRLSKLARDGLADDVDIADSLQKRPHSEYVNAVTSAGHEF
jgi:DNA-binding response OmpR family regulator